jgi:hypothetical protein
MSYDDDTEIERPKRIGMSYDHWKSTEPDDSDVVYHENWAAAEQAAKRMVESARRINERDAAVKAVKARILDLVRKKAEAWASRHDNASVVYQAQHDAMVSAASELEQAIRELDCHISIAESVLKE